MNEWFMDEARKGNVYHAHNTTHGDVTVIHATNTGLVLENPMGSGKDLVIAQATFVGTTLGNIGEFGLVTGPERSAGGSASLTAATVHNARLGGAGRTTGVAFCSSVATLPATPIWIRPMGSSRQTGAVSGASYFVADFDGTLIVAPGTFIAFATLTTKKAGLGSFTWAEVDILS